MWQSSNPALTNNDAIQEHLGHLAGTKSNTTSISGVMSKTAILLAVAFAAGGLGYGWVYNMTAPSVLWISNIAALIAVFGVGLAIRSDPKRASFLAPVYAAFEGLFLGALSGALDFMLVQMDIKVVGGVATQACIIVFGIAMAMLLVYYSGLIKPGKTFTAVLCTATGGIMIVYMLSFVLGMFGIAVPFVTLTDAFAGGTAAWIGLGVNVLILGVASLWLILDYNRVDEMVKNGAPKYMEWYCAFGLMVSLAWIYYEAVKIVFRVAILLSNRD